jgi:hypothetical protein
MGIVSRRARRPTILAAAVWEFYPASTVRQNGRHLRCGEGITMRGSGDGKPTAKEKRRIYVAFFIIAFAVDLVVGLVRYGTYVPTLIGLAIMITSALFLIYSLVRDR